MLKRKAVKLELRAADVDNVVKGFMAKSHECTEENDHGMAAKWEEDAEFERKKSIKMRRSYWLIHEEHIPRLVRTMADLQTVTLPGFNDEGVVIAP